MKAASAEVAAGWYEDPERPGAERWWTGRAWSDLDKPLFEESSPRNGTVVGAHMRRLARTVTRTHSKANS